MLFIKERCPCPKLSRAGPNSFVARVPVIAALAPVKRALNLHAETCFVKTTLPCVETVSSGASRAVSTRAG